MCSKSRLETTLCLQKDLCISTHYPFFENSRITFLSCFTIFSNQTIKLIFSLSLDIFEKISLFRQLADVLEGLSIVFLDGTYSNVSFTDIKFHPYYPGLQAQIDISKNLEENTVKKIFFVFKNSKNYSIEIELDDGSWDAVRPLFKRKMRQKGTA